MYRQILKNNNQIILKAHKVEYSFSQSLDLKYSYTSFEKKKSKDVLKTIDIHGAQDCSRLKRKNIALHCTIPIITLWNKNIVNFCQKYLGIILWKCTCSICRDAAVNSNRWVQIIQNHTVYFSKSYECLNNTCQMDEVSFGNCLEKFSVFIFSFLFFF